mgnify:CR=1 FL=1
MIGVAAAVVANGGANVFRDGIQITGSNLRPISSASSGLILERVVHVGDVSLMMLGVMNFHRARVDVRLERVVGVG